MIADCGLRIAESGTRGSTRQRVRNPAVSHFAVRSLYVALVSVAAILTGCNAEQRNAETTAQPDAAETGVTTKSATQTILFLGTSLTAGYGVSPDQAYPALIQAKIDSAGLPYRVINAGVSGETSAGALRRTEWLLRQPFDVLVLETGANDMLRGADLDSTRANIQAIIERVEAARPNAKIVLAGMMAPPNLGNRYLTEFRSIYPELAEKNELPLIPFLLEGVGGEAELNLADGIHPNAAGQRRVAENVWEVLRGEL
jgi:acyl-CoA thioesterase-1